MMKPTQEQVLAWAREALSEASGTDYYDYTGETHWWGEVKSVVSFATLAYEAGRKDENEACAKVAERRRRTHEQFFGGGNLAFVYTCCMVVPCV